MLITVIVTLLIFWVVIKIETVGLFFIGKKGMHIIMAGKVVDKSIIHKLFSWKTSIVINDVEFHVRIVGDGTVESARDYSLLKSRKLRRRLRDENSDDYIIHIDVVNEYDDEELRNSITNLEMYKVMREYMTRVPKRTPDPLGDFPTLEEQEQYKEEEEKIEEEYIAEVKAHVDNWQGGFEKQLEKLERAELEKRWKTLIVDRVAEEEFQKEFENYILSQSIYLDANFQTQAFTLEEFLSLPKDIRDKFRDAYNSIDMSSEELKK